MIFSGRRPFDRINLGVLVKRGMGDDDVKIVELGEDDVLHPDQARVLELIRQGRNVFMTGGGGVGKSFVIHAVVAQEQAAGRQVAIAASTGVAADQIGGCTLHALLGLGLAKESADKLAAAASRNARIRNRWNRLSLLIIDEVSMIDPDFFEAVDFVARSLRRELTKPFGGIQLLLSGDFYQLPPVFTGGARDPSLPTFCFQARAWQDAVHDTVELTHIFRQQNDSQLSELLQRARRGNITLGDIELLSSRVNAPLTDFIGIEPTRMHARRANVDEINASNLASLGDVQTETFTATVHWEIDPTKRRIADVQRKAMMDSLNKASTSVVNNAAAKKEVQLKIGAQVMLLCNLDVSNGLVNGSRGVVTRFSPSPTSQRLSPVVRFARSEIVVDRYTWEHKVEDVGTVYYKQVPLQLAWAVTIHKAQGLSLDCVEIALDRSVFEYGQAYVALSRVRTLAGLRLLSFTPATLIAHPLVTTFYTQLASPPSSSSAILPASATSPATSPAISPVSATASAASAAAASAAPANSSALTLDAHPTNNSSSKSCTTEPSVASIALDVTRNPDHGRDTLDSGARPAKKRVLLF